MKWTDTLDIAIALTETHPDTDPRTVRFTDLMQWVLDLPGFGQAFHFRTALRLRRQVIEIQGLYGLRRGAAPFCAMPPMKPVLQASPLFR